MTDRDEDHAPGGTCDHGVCCPWHCQSCQTPDRASDFTEAEAQRFVGLRYRSTADYSGVPAGTIGVVSGTYHRGGDSWGVDITWEGIQPGSPLDHERGGLTDGFSCSDLFLRFTDGPAVGQRAMVPLGPEPTRMAVSVSEARPAATPFHPDNPAGESPARIADGAIELFLEYRDRHGQSEDDARRSAVRDVAEGVAVDLEALKAEAAADRTAANIAFSRRHRRVYHPSLGIEP